MIELIVRLALLVLQPSGLRAPAPRPDCNCAEPYARNAIRCDTTMLKNAALLYYRYTCDSMWLTLQQADGSRTTIYSDTTTTLFPLAYRLAYHLLAEYDQTLLFRYGCPANGPCQIAVVDKRTGILLLERSEPELLNRDVAIPGTSTAEPRMDFLLYASDDGESLLLYYLDTRKVHTIPTAPLRLPTSPDFYLESVKEKAHQIVLTYKDADDNASTRHIDLRRFPR